MLMTPEQGNMPSYLTFQLKLTHIVAFLFCNSELFLKINTKGIEAR